MVGVRCDNAPDPDNPDLEKARHQTQRNLRLAMKELRQLQADRWLKAHLALDIPGTAAVKDIHKYLGPARTPAAPAPQASEAGIANIEARLAAIIEGDLEKLKNRTQFPGPSPRSGQPRSAAPPPPSPL